MVVSDQKIPGGTITTRSSATGVGFSLSKASCIFLTPRSMVDNTVCPRPPSPSRHSSPACRGRFFFRARRGAGRLGHGRLPQVDGLRRVGRVRAAGAQAAGRPHRGGSASSLPAGLSLFSIVLGGVWRRPDPCGAAPTPRNLGCFC